MPYLTVTAPDLASVEPRRCVHSRMNRTKQFISEVEALGSGFRVSLSRRRVVVTAAIIFPVLVVLFLSVGGGAIV